MKKLFAFVALLGVFTFGVNSVVFADHHFRGDTTATEQINTAAEEEVVEEVSPSEEATAEAIEESPSFHQVIKQKFIEGGPSFMGIVLICLILGLALCIERIIYLNKATTNTEKLLSDVENALKSGGVESAKDVCRNTAGPIASIFYQGLDRSNEGIDVVEKSVVAYGSVQMGLLERGLLDFIIHRLSSNAWFHGYSNRYDWCF